uniref:TIR domain-containing protein n=1 Tax=Macrostomum lignano TaxID=282301 RepID=A0A1I8IUS2_9PLAT
RVSGRADVFISYCWANSQEAVKAGHGKATSRSIGFGDPRKLKKHLEEAGGLSCWIDIERLGENGMFEDLCQGLKACKLVVACLSDEYVASKNCQMEYRFAHLTLNRPMVICVVGTGVLWESTEIGMMSLGHPKVNFQAASESCYDALLSAVTETLERYYPIKRPDSKDSLRKRRKSSLSSPGGGGAMFQELIELAQRKVYRQFSGFLDTAEQFPCLIVADIYTDSDNPADSPDKTEFSAVAAFADDAAADEPPLSDDGVEDEPRFQFRFRLLCEHEGGWHAAPGAGLPLRLGRDAALQLLGGLAPLLLRLALVLRHSRRSGLDTAADPVAGGRLLDHLRAAAERAGPEADLRQLHAALRQHLRRRDPGIAAGLRRCHLPSGKILWLCPEHQSQPRTVVLADAATAVPAADAGDTAEDEEEELLAQVLSVVGSGAVASVAAESAAAEAAEQSSSKRKLAVAGLGRIDEAVESPEPSASAASSAAAAAAATAATPVKDARQGRSVVLTNSTEAEFCVSVMVVSFLVMVPSAMVSTSETRVLMTVSGGLDVVSGGLDVVSGGLDVVSGGRMSCLAGRMSCLAGRMSCLAGRMSCPALARDANGWVDVEIAGPRCFDTGRIDALILVQLRGMGCPSTSVNDLKSDVLHFIGSHLSSLVRPSDFSSHTCTLVELAKVATEYIHSDSWQVISLLIALPGCKFSSNFVSRAPGLQVSTSWLLVEVHNLIGVASEAAAQRSVRERRPAQAAGALAALGLQQDNSSFGRTVGNLEFHSASILRFNCQIRALTFVVLNVQLAKQQIGELTRHRIAG